MLDSGVSYCGIVPPVFRQLLLDVSRAARDRKKRKYRTPIILLLEKAVYTGVLSVLQRICSRESL